MMDKYHHKTNVQFLTSVGFWRKVQALASEISIFSVSLNFGKWETGQSHAHAHLELTLPAAQQLASQNPIMKGRFYPQENLRKNVLALEQRITPIAVYNMEDRLDQLEAKIDNLATSLHSK
jgi:hypothetical protein